MKILKLFFLLTIFSFPLLATTWIKPDTTTATTSPQPYDNNQDISTTLSISDAIALKITITGNTENNWDFLYITIDGDTHTYDGNNIDDTFVGAGNTVSLRFTSDGSQTRSGVTVSIEKTLPDKNTREFDNVLINGQKSISMNGNILLIGNQLLCQNSSDGGTCTAPTVGATNNSVDQHKAKINTSAGAPDSNSWAKLTLNKDKSVILSTPDTIVFARLYWSARIVGTVSENDKNASMQIQIQGPGENTYTPLTSDIDKFNWYKNDTVFDYAASTDVTSYVKTHGAGNYSVGGIKATNGTNKFASWALIVVVQNDERDLNNISIYDGFHAIYNGSPYPTSKSVPASGFLTPVGDEPFEASFFAYTGESESGLDDSVTIENINGTPKTVVDGYDDSDDVFNASIWTPENGYRSDNSGEANPNFQNVVGTDIDKMQINKKGDSTKQILSNGQTSTNIKVSSGGDRYTLNMFAFETELHYPKMCYDYTYSQDGFVYTEVNTDGHAPYIDIPSNSGGDVEVTIYIKSQDSDVDFKHISIYSDNNLSKIKYKNGEFKKTLVNSFGYPSSYEGETNSANCNETSNTSYDVCHTNTPSENFRVGLGANIDGYPLVNSGEMSSGDFLYFKYTLKPNNSAPLYTPLSLYADLQYALSGGGSLIDPVYDLPLGGDRMPLCPPSSNYVPEWGIFNVIDSQLNAGRDGTTGQRFLNNLLTQVTNRQFTSDVVSLDASVNPPIELQDINTSVAIELVDIRGFHDVNISCQEPAVKFTNRVHMNFNNESRKPITLSTIFAKQDASYRIWYIHDGNVSHLIENWTALTDSDGELTGIQGLYNQIPTAPAVCSSQCSDTVGTTNSTDCYECLRTYFGYPLCSRDNFSIRPEAFAMVLRDANSTSSTTIINNSTQSSTSLAAGYNYTVDINATNHIDSDGTLGYNTQFVIDDENASISLAWNPETALTCNDETNSTFGYLISNGTTVDNTISNSDVGLYKLNITDKQWTSIDQGIGLNRPEHHAVGDFWLTDVSDCIEGSSIVSDLTYTTSTRTVGCKISSNHTVDRTVLTNLPALAYSDLNITFNPYKFAVNITKSHGVDNNVTFNSDTFIYMSNDNTMAFHLNGSIAAKAYGGGVLSNFVNACYAKDISVTIDKTAISGDTAYGYTFINDNPLINERTGDINTTIISIDVNASDYNTTSNGVINTHMHLNFTRNWPTPSNPEQITFRTYDVNCTTPSECNINVDQTNKYTTGTYNIDQNITHYYGRTNAPRQRYIGNDGNASIYFEVYCNNCNKQLLPNKLNTNYINDPRWYSNTKHTSSDGTAGNISQKFTSKVTGTNPTSTSPAKTTLNYTKNVFPYKATMQNAASGWLIYNKFKEDATTNEFEVEFDKTGSSWSGKTKTDSKTVHGGADKTNRRIMW